ncbi:hypothetical protein [Rubinisphaera margarita]|uniref:hypothetical protein n=1 Tax=Rubinisphaera margarita TaxID=2909586 RepID=UPI001EE8171E|nr:hypothetical protein [Rubinisphaera margarita]MCG6157265.1 hypothetical protein [Rubinisphaera margarita]
MTQERAWYQDGFIMIFVVLSMIYIGCMYLEYQWSQIPRIYPRLSGQVVRPMLSMPDFSLELWHQHAGNLRNGVMSVTLSGESIAENARHQTHSFEVWPPNRENSITLKFPLQRFDQESELKVEITLTAANSHPSYSSFVWKGEDWTEETFYGVPPTAGQ